MKADAELTKLASMIAIEAPDRQGQYSITAKVSWDLVLQIRKRLEELGYDWKAIQVFAKEKARKARAKA